MITFFQEAADNVFNFWQWSSNILCYIFQGPASILWTYFAGGPSNMLHYIFSRRCTSQATHCLVFSRWNREDNSLYFVEWWANMMVYIFEFDLPACSIVFFRWTTQQLYEFLDDFPTKILFYINEVDQQTDCRFVCRWNRHNVALYLLFILRGIGLNMFVFQFDWNLVPGIVDMIMASGKFTNRFNLVSGKRKWNSW